MGQEQLSRTFDKIGQGISNLRPAFENITKDFYTTQKGVFQGEGSFEDNPSWAKLSPAYKAWKDKNYPGKGILELTGRLKRAATSKDAMGSIYKLNNLALTMGVDIQVGGWNLAALHQFGTSRMPAREVIRLTNMEKNRWVRIFRDYIFKLTEKK